MRLLLILTAIAILAMWVMYALTRDSRYARLAWQILRAVVFLLLLVGVLIVVERYLLTGWARLF